MDLLEITANAAVLCHVVREKFNGVSVEHINSFFSVEH
jgi:hypothetical protein